MPDPIVPVPDCGNLIARELRERGEPAPDVDLAVNLCRGDGDIGDLPLRELAPLLIREVRHLSAEVLALREGLRKLLAARAEVQKPWTTALDICVEALLPEHQPAPSP